MTNRLSIKGERTADGAPILIGGPQTGSSSPIGPNPAEASRVVECDPSPLS